MENQMTLFETEEAQQSKRELDCPDPDGSIGRNKKAYIEECKQRWYGDPLHDAVWNWNLFDGIYREDIVAILKPYLRDELVRGLDGKEWNPQGTLTSWLWVQSDHHPWIYSFCEHYQTCHLRRGLIAYCKQVIAELQSNTEVAGCEPDDSSTTQPR